LPAPEPAIHDFHQRFIRAGSLLLEQLGLDGRVKPGHGDWVARFMLQQTSAA
jgi:hypothetical protein